MTKDTWLDFIERCVSAERVILVAPYMKLDTMTMTLAGAGSDAFIECITRWTPHDIRMAVSDIACRNLVRDRGGQFRLHNNLHAKYYRADEYTLIGSANVTRSGMGFSTSPNLEILTEAPPDFDWLGFERRLLSESRIVSDYEYAVWEECPVAEGGPIESGLTTVDLGEWRPQTRNPVYLWLSYRGECLPSDEQYQLALSDLKAIGIPVGLDREEFDGWIRTGLLASPFVRFVLDRVSVMREPEKWDVVCNEWDVPNRAAASRLIETVENWIRHYGLADLTISRQY